MGDKSGGGNAFALNPGEDKVVGVGKTADETGDGDEGGVFEGEGVEGADFEVVLGEEASERVGGKEVEMVLKVEAEPVAISETGGPRVEVGDLDDQGATRGKQGANFVEVFFGVF